MSRSPPISRISSKDQAEAAVPTLRVMRLQSPELHQPQAGTLGGQCLLQTSLCLPDSLGVYVGEKFTAYLGILNSSKVLPIRNLTVSAQLQTPSQRWQLPSQLDQSNSARIVVESSSSVDAIVSHDIEEAGQHILRVEVGYSTPEGGTKTFRKFYRFNVVSPLNIEEQVVRSGDSTCFVSLSVEFNKQQGNSDMLVIASADFVPADGLDAERIGSGSALLEKSADKHKSALELFDSCCFLSKGACFRYLFKVKAVSNEAILRGIAAGDLLGKAVFTWRKAMGETGRVSSPPLFSPSIRAELPDPERTEEPSSNFAVYQSGLSVDVAASAATRNSRTPMDSNDVARRLPVTIEPIDPPPKMQLGIPTEVQFLVVNHSGQSATLQVQFRLSRMTGLSICGPSFKMLGEVQPNGGSTVVSMRFLPMAAGLLRVQGCCVVDLVSGREIFQPVLFQTFVEQEAVGQ